MLEIRRIGVSVRGPGKVQLQAWVANPGYPPVLFTSAVFDRAVLKEKLELLETLCKEHEHPGDEPKASHAWGEW